MKFITNDCRECGDLIMLPQRYEIATSLCSSQQMRRNKADGVLSTRLRWGKMLIMNRKSTKIKIFKLFSRKAKEHTENTEIKVNIDIFYELFRLNKYSKIP